jgi:hypothetical protein
MKVVFLKEVLCVFRMSSTKLVGISRPRVLCHQRSFSDPCFASIFSSIFDDFRLHFGINFQWFSMFLTTLFRVWNLYRFFIDFGMDFGLIVDRFLMILRSCIHLAKPSKTMTLTMNLHGFTHRKNMKFHDVHDMFRYPFWHVFLISFGIDFGSILKAFSH